MLYGHQEMVDNRVATLVTSADTIEEYDAFLDVVRGQSKDKRNFNEMYTSKALQHMVEELYQGFKKPIHVFYHDDVAQRDEFAKEWNLKILENGVQSRDKQGDMVFEQKYRQENNAKQARDAAIAAAEASGKEYTGEREKTLAEMHGLEENDPWDRRSEEDKEADREMKRQIDAAKAAGTMSDDSFTGGKLAPAGPEPDKMTKPGAPSQGKLTITDTDGMINAEGSLNISNIRATKVGGPVDENLKQARQDAFQAVKDEKLAGRKQFSPEDFAAVLAGDGSSDANNIRGDKDIRAGTKPIDRPGLSDVAEDARQAIQSAEANAMDQTRKENDFKAQQERDQGVFRGCDLFGEDDVDWEDIPSALQTALEDIGAGGAKASVKDYPFNSQLGDKSVIPFDTFGRATLDAGREVTAVAGMVNIQQHGAINMGATAALVVSREDQNKDGWVIYQRTGGRLGNTIVTSVVKIR